MITLAFFVSLLYLYFVLFFDAKKHPFGCFFWCLLIRYGAIFWCFRRFPRVTRRGSSSGGGQICQNAEIPPSFMSLPVFSVNACIYSTLRPFLCQHLGALPQTPASLAAPQGQAVKTQPPDPVAKCWVGSKASRVKMHGFAALDPSPPP